VVLEADREIELRCGKASLLLRHDGQIVMRGVHMRNEATGVQKIRGGKVQIN
jgi:hypothetical protein